MSENIVFDTPEGIAFYSLCAHIHRLRLEGQGLRFKRQGGRSTLASARAQFGIRGRTIVEAIAELEDLKERFLAGKAKLPNGGTSGS